MKAASPRRAAARWGSPGSGAARWAKSRTAYNHYDGHHRDLPLLRFAGLSGPFVTAAPRPGQRPTGAENAMIVRRVLKRSRPAWPQTRIVRRGDARLANPEWMQLAMADPQLDFLLGPAGNRALSPWAEPFLAPHRRRLETARRAGFPLPTPTHSSHHIAYRAESWPQAFRVILKAEVMALGDNPRSDRTSDPRLLANHPRLFFAGVASVLHQALRPEVLVHTELAKAQPLTVILELFELAVRVVAFQDRSKPHLPTRCPVKDLPRRVTEIRFLTRPPPPLRA